MKVLALPLTILAIVFGVVLAPKLQERWEDDNAHQRTLALIEEQQLSYQAQLDQQRAAATLPGKIATEYGFYILAFVAAGGILWTLRDAYMQRRAPIVRYNPDRPLVSRRMIEQVDPDLISAMMRALELSGQAQIARAQHQPGQSPVTYSPHITNTAPRQLQQVEQPTAPALPADLPALDVLPGECTLSALQRAGIICRSGNSLHVGTAIADGTPIYLELSTWGALALGGKSRTGKTSRITYYLAQAALSGWRLVICDKHGGGGKPDALLQKVGALESSFLLPPATSREDINRRIQQTYTIGKRRIEGADSTRYPIILVCDEFTNLVLNDWLEDKTLNQLMAIANEFAGVNVHAIIIGHDWSASCLGKERGAAFRRITTHRIAHRLDAAGAQFLLPAGMGKQAEGLTIGQAVYVNDEGDPILVDCPLLHDEDIAYAAEHSGQWRGTYHGAAVEQPAPALHQPYTSSTPASAPASVTHQDAENPKAARVRELLRQKATQTEILSEVWHLDSKERGAAYKQASEEYRSILAELAGGVV